MLYRGGHHKENLFVFFSIDTDAVYLFGYVGTRIRALPTFFKLLKSIDGKGMQTKDFEICFCSNYFKKKVMNPKES